MGEEYVTTGEFRGHKGQRSRVTGAKSLNIITSSQLEPSATAAAAQRVGTALAHLGAFETQNRETIKQQLMNMPQIIHMNASIIGLALILLDIKSGPIDQYAMHTPTMDYYIGRVVEMDSTGIVLSSDVLKQRIIDTRVDVLRYAIAISEFRKKHGQPQ